MVQLNFLLGENEEIKPGGLTFYRDGKVSIVFSTIYDNGHIKFEINFDKDEWDELSKDIIKMNKGCIRRCKR